MAVVAPAQLQAHPVNREFNTIDDELDAQGEEDFEGDLPVGGVSVSAVSAKIEGSDKGMQNEGKGKDDKPEKHDFTTTAAKPPIEADGGNVDLGNQELSEAERSDVEVNDDSSKGSSTDRESAAVEEWDGGSEGVEDAEAEIATRTNCIFCGQDEDHDPSEDFEEYMSCIVCGDNSHRKCARDANSLSSDEDSSKWRCPGCVENAFEPEITEETASRRRPSASKFTRDLLPAQRGVLRPDSHSVFNTLILDDDPLDGSRSLRKRKASSEQDEANAVPHKRRRNQDSSRAASRASGTPGPVAKKKEPSVLGGISARTDEAAEVESTSTRKSRSSRASRPRALKATNSNPAIIIRNVPGRLMLAVQVDPTKLAQILSLPPKKKRQRPPRRQPPLASMQPDKSAPPPPSNQYSTPFYSFHERENDELKSKPYGGILNDIDADTSKTLPLAADRVRFNEARQKAEEEWKLKTANAEADLEHKSRSSQKLAGPPSKIKCVNFGGYEIETWYAAPYPEEYSRNRVLYICEFCLKYMSSDYIAWRHKLKCPAKHPPGDEIYRSNSISVFEVDGRKNPVYCQNLCLLAKLFLGSKTLYYDVEPFLFYVMTEYDELGCHFVGYFSKEKRPSSLNNVSCILTLPTHQRKGYGNLLISFSYLLTRVEGKTGSPEKPLSDMGLVSYRNYWRLVLSYELLRQRTSVSIVDLSDRTGMTADDIVAALEGLRALVRDPVTKKYALRLDYTYFQQCIDTWEAKRYVTLDPKALVWTPYIMGHGDHAQQHDRAPPLPTIAPREGDEQEQTVQTQPEEGVQQSIAAADVSAAESSHLNGNIIAAPAEPLPTVNGLSENAISTYLPPSTQSQVPTQSINPSPSKPQPSISNFPKTPQLPCDSFTPHPISPIPPTRYELFPPIPGTASRRRGRWRGGTRRSVNAALSNNGTPGAIETEPPLRRTGTLSGIRPDTERGRGKLLTQVSANGSPMPNLSSFGREIMTRRTRSSGTLDLIDDRKEDGKDREEMEEEPARAAAINDGTARSIDEGDIATGTDLDVQVQQRISQDMVRDGGGGDDVEAESDEEEDEDDQIDAAADDSGDEDAEVGSESDSDSDNDDPSGVDTDGEVDIDVDDEDSDDDDDA